jgi:hypothetical protein
MQMNDLTALERELRRELEQVEQEIYYNEGEYIKKTANFGKLLLSNKLT